MALQAPTTPSAAGLRETLVAGANAGGGWGYYPGKASRLEPTCWALLALGADATGDASTRPHRDFLARCQRADGWLVEDAGWPVNVAFNALTAFTWFVRPELATEEQRRGLLGALESSKGVQVAASNGSDQDNSLQGWSWVDATFSWVEPTSWGLLALKKARRAGFTSDAADARIAEAERVLVDRACRSGGWNYGNAVVMERDLRPYAPTTALALLALQDRRDDPAVVDGVAFLEVHWRDEVSAASLGLSLLALGALGRSVDRVDDALAAHAADARSFGNLRGIALSLVALSSSERTRVFEL